MTSGRISKPAALHTAQQQLLNFSTYLHTTSLEPQLLELMSLRASQINGCAFCLAMHVRDLRERGEREDRLAVLPAWRETTWFTERERAALAWTEAVTTLDNQQVPQHVFAQAREVFEESELVDLTLAVIAINGWNRLNIAFENAPIPFTTSAPTPAGV